MYRLRLVALVLLVSLVFGAARAETRYTVQPGDSLSRVAGLHGVTVEVLQRRNGLSGTLIRPGQELLIPGPIQGPGEPKAGLSPAPDLPPGFGLHRLGPGEGLAEVSARYGLSEAALLRVNADLMVGGGPSTLFLRVPPRPGLLLRLEADSDVLTLALAHGLAPADLMRANGLTAPRLAAGRWVFVPDPLAHADASSPAVASRPQGFGWPLGRSGVITSGFGPRALSVAGSTFHAGLDIAAPPGTPVLAVAAGVVTRAGWGGNYGYVVYLDHEGGVQTRYAHLNRIDVRVGERVPLGGQLGLVGETGSTTGPHLHFEVRVGGRAVDPRGYLP